MSYFDPKPLTVAVELEDVPDRYSRRVRLLSAIGLSLAAWSLVLALFVHA